jgi:hypothetical protein
LARVRAVNNIRNRSLKTKRSLVPAVVLALIAFPEPVTTVLGVALLCLCSTLPQLTEQKGFRPAPCSGVVILRGTL